MHYSHQFFAKGCGPITSEDLEVGLENLKKKRLSKEEEREQMRLGLTMETKDNGKGSRIITRETYQRWPNGVVPYILSCSYDEDDRGVIATAIDHIEKNSCVRFRGANVEDKDYVTIDNTSNGCYVEYVG